MKKVLLSSVLLFLCIAIQAQTNITLKGIIKDQTTGKVIPNVSITIVNTSKGSTSNEDGYYSISLTSKDTKIKFSSIGYSSITKDVSGYTKDTVLPIFLTKSVTKLSEVTINGNAKSITKSILAVNKLPIKNIDAPVTTNSVDASLLEQRGVTNLGDAMKSATGVRPINRYGGFQTFRIRGFNNFVLLVDGVRDERHNLATSAPSTNLANVERIEVLKGPASVLFGHSALGGIINIVRKKPTYEEQGNFRVAYGSYNSYTMNAGIGGPISDKLRYRLDFGMTRTDGWRDYGVATNNGSLALDFTPTDKDKLELFVQLNKDIYDTDTGIPMDEDGSLVPGLNPETRFNDPQDYLKHKRYDAQLKYTHIFNDRLKVTNLLSYSQDDIDYLSTEYLVLNSAKDSITRDFPFYFNHQTNTLQNQIDVNYALETGKIKHKLVVGNSISYLDRKTFRGEVIGPGAFTTIAVQNPILNQGHIEAVDNKVDVKKELVTAFYLQDWLDISEKLKALVGIRYDIFDGTYYRDLLDPDRTINTPGDRTEIPTDALTYRGGLVYQPLRNTLSFFASYANYFKPSRRITPEGKIFDPEKGYQIEAGIKFIQKEKITATVSSFYMQKNNIVERTTVNDFQQIGSADSKGFELDIESNPMQGLYIKTGYAYVDAKVRSYDNTLQTISAGNALRFSPKNTFNFWSNYDIQQGIGKGIGIGFGVNYVGSNYTNSSNTFVLPAYTIMDTSIYYQAKKLRLGFNLNNIADKLYYTDAIYDSQFFVGQGRNFQISIGYNF